MITVIASTLIAWGILMIMVSDTRTMFDVYFNRMVALIIMLGIAAIAYVFMT